MNITIPEPSVVVLVGASSSGKSTFARRHFTPTEVVSSDSCRALVADDENARDVDAVAFSVLHAIASARLRLRRPAVIDSTNVRRDSRRPLVALARDSEVLAVAVVFDLPELLLQERLRSRPDRAMGPHVIENQCFHLRRSLPGLRAEGFGPIHVLRSVAEVDAAVIERRRGPEPMTLGL